MIHELYIGLLGWIHHQSLYLVARIWCTRIDVCAKGGFLLLADGIGRF